MEHNLSAPQSGMLNVKPVNELISAMAKEPDPQPLCDDLWTEGEVACLFADSNVGKSILAVQIAEQIAQQRPVLYVDCELTDKQFQLRYTNKETGAYHVFPPLFFRATIATDRIGSGNFEDALLKDIEKAAFENKIDVIIIDNLTYVCNTSEKGDAAGVFMIKLKALQMRYGWSLLIIAHTPKRDDSSAITLNHLAGSRKLFNFFDTVFALGKSKQDDNYRYLKQLKVRGGEFEYGDENVAVFELEKAEDGWLHLVYRKNCTETVQLNPYRPDDIQIAREVVKLHEEGLSYREVGKKLDISKSRAQRIYQKYRDKVASEEEFKDAALEFEQECPNGPDYMS